MAQILAPLAPLVDAAVGVAAEHAVEHLPSLIFGRNGPTTDAAHVLHPNMPYGRKRKRSSIRKSRTPYAKRFRGRSRVRTPAYKRKRSRSAFTRRTRRNVGTRTTRMGNRSKNSSKAIYKSNKHDYKPGKAVRLNAVLPKRQRVLLPYCGRATDLSTLGGADAYSYGASVSCLRPMSLGAVGSDATWRGQMSINVPGHDSTPNNQGQPYGYDFMFDKYENALVLGVRYEIDLSSAVTAIPLRLAVVCSNLLTGGDCNPANYNSSMWCPPYNRKNVTYMKSKRFTPYANGGMSVRNFLTGYIPFHKGRPGITLKSRLQDTAYWESVNTTSTASPTDWNILLMPDTTGTATTAVYVDVRVWLDTLFFGRKARVEG